MRSGVTVTTILALAGLARAVEPGIAPSSAPSGASQSEATKGPAIDPKADAALRDMSSYLSRLKSFRVEATTVDEKFTSDGHKIQQLEDSHLMLERPSALRVDRVGPAGTVTFRYDGKRFAVFNKDHNVYATAPAPAKLDAAIDDARERLRIDAPGGDLLVSDPYRSLTDGASEIRYIGLEPIAGGMAHHIAATKKNTDWQLWIKEGPEPVPLRFVVTSNDLPGRPEFTLEMRNWQPNAVVQASNFSFTPPPGAKTVAFARAKKDEHGGE